jgi:Tfp pilus assembly protein FimT
MKRKIWSSQDGLTLVELLAGLAISTIVVGLLSMILYSALKNNEITQSHIDLRQEANVIVTKLRTVHEGKKEVAETSSYLLYYEQEKDKEGNLIKGDININSDSVQEVLNSDRVILKGIDFAGKKVLIENPRTGEGPEDKLENNTDETNSEQGSGGHLYEEDKSFILVNRHKPLLVTLIVVDKETKKELQIDTVIDGGEGTVSTGTNDPGSSPGTENPSNPPDENDPDTPTDPNDPPDWENPPDDPDEYEKWTQHLLDIVKAVLGSLASFFLWLLGSIIKVIKRFWDLLSGLFS